LDRVDQNVILLTSNRQVEFSTARARQLTTEYFGRPFQGKRLPDDLDRWVRSQEALLGSTRDVPGRRVPLFVERGPRRLMVRLILDAGQRILRLEEQGNISSPVSLESLGLTRREAEVLAWVREGKANAEIGTILGARPRTVAKHLERIFLKLGVETRTAAARLAVSVSTTDVAEPS
jgi:DNA-binding CsgD family transcriptional regulator